MTKCVKCGVSVADITDVCPLCHHVLAGESEVEYNAYPMLRGKNRRKRFVENLILFCSIVAAIAVLIVDYFVSPGLSWSILVTLILIYGNALLRLSITGKNGYTFKAISGVIMTIAFLIFIDHLTGYRGWAVNYVFPGLILLMDLAILVLMIVNRRNWQSYMLWQLLTILLSIVAMVLWATGVISALYITVIALGVSVLLFLGTLIIGDERARTELVRRFHI